METNDTRYMIGTLLQRVDNYRQQKYDINIQLWDEVNIYVHAKDTVQTELMSLGGYDRLEQALRELLKILDRWNQ